MARLEASCTVRAARPQYKSNGYSRWGVKGSNEVSEGLTAVYRYEEGLGSCHYHA